MAFDDRQYGLSKFLPALLQTAALTPPGTGSAVKVESLGSSGPSGGAAGGLRTRNPVHGQPVPLF